MKIAAEALQPVKFCPEQVLLVAHVDPVAPGHLTCKCQFPVGFQHGKFLLQCLAANIQKFNNFRSRQVVRFRKCLREAGVFLDRLCQQGTQACSQAHRPCREYCECGAFGPIAVTGRSDGFHQPSPNQPVHSVVQGAWSDLEQAVFMAVDQQLVHLIRVHGAFRKQAQRGHGQR